MRKPLIAGNWKMNKTPYQAGLLIQEIKKLDLDGEVEALVCVPSIDIPSVREAMEGSSLRLGAENFFYEEEGAYTGEVSGPMLKDYEVEYIIIGHSERRTIFKEDDAMIQKKVKAALDQGFKPILCVGESLEEREAGLAEKKVAGQLAADFQGLDEGDFDKIVIAYEPIWAIGTGKTASSDDAEEMCAFIRKEITKSFGEKTGQAVRIQYGGSVKPGKVKDIMSRENIDGALVGGASLEAESFALLVNYKKN
ncbi:triose-phosphate isomerase [Kallipyga massiliensis]|uniref:triose-phosphate isomerase n=1 Tax=Kallipyga massiliensis TaxID=1472764 RepID=UPI0026EFB25E|nr:triose-phosphate isomerase [Kallipyga massiliensis]